MHKHPYLRVVDEPRVMKGPGAPRQTVFGVLGHTKDESEMKSLGGLVHETTGSKKVHKGEVEKASPKLVTERHIVGPAAKTKMPGAHYAQVPYPGHFMSAVGREL
jgi:hypothetical protein